MVGEQLGISQGRDWGEGSGFHRLGVDCAYFDLMPFPFISFANQVQLLVTCSQTVTFPYCLTSRASRTDLLSMRY
jgi:hypothetical protein